MRSYIPTINVSSLLKTDFNNLASKNTLRKIEKACVDVGFFQITGHGLDLNQIKKTCEIGNIFFNLPESKKNKLSPKKWNKKNNNVYRGYFPNNVNGKEGLDIGDLRVNKSYASKIRSQYIEYLNLNKCFNKNAINILKNYFDSVYELSETLFKSIIKLNRKNPDISSIAFSRLKTLSTLRFNYYPNQSKPVEISKQDGVALGCETQVDSGIFTVLISRQKRRSSSTK
jgi:isopenicillin N synthase-like dioxygenase